MAIDDLNDYIGRVPGPWSLTFGAAPPGTSLAEPNFGFLQAIITDVVISEDGGVVSFINNNNFRADFVLISLYNPRQPSESVLVLDYFNAVVPLSENESMNWFLIIEKYNPLARYGISI